MADLKDAKAVAFLGIQFDPSENRQNLLIQSLTKDMLTSETFDDESVRINLEGQALYFSMSRPDEGVISLVLCRLETPEAFEAWAKESAVYDALKSIMVYASGKRDDKGGFKEAVKKAKDALKDYEQL